MKDEFNKKKFITVHDESNQAQQIEKAAIRLIGPYAKQGQVCRSLIVFKKEGCDPLPVREDAYDIVGMIQGNPSRMDVETWTKDIIARRMKKALDAIRQLGLDYTKEGAELDRDHIVERNLLDADKQKLSMEKKGLERQIDGSPRLKTAAWLLSMDKDSSKSFVGSIRKTLGHNLAGVEIGILFAHAKCDSRLALLEQHAQQMKAEHDHGQRAREQKYNREMDVLRRYSEDPAMGVQDRQVLQKMINDHRIGNDDPEFRYNRTPLSGVYYQASYERIHKGEGTPFARDIEIAERARARALEDARRSQERNRGRDRDRDRGPSR